ncbi:MAG TPA: universal stress protein [Verrucomicrobiota bacterium]|nr:universal stress protein [Verrucomicrobiota bacterium]HNT15335.1 universal stress protein [Verrucomicrobiota bacterium]
MKIVCGTDFSIHAASAADAAAAMAIRCKTPLELVHGLEPATLEFLSKEGVDEVYARLRRKLGTEANRLRAGGTEVTEKMILGRPQEVLVNEASTSGADLIVVSSIGRIAPSRWLVGSVAEKTAQLSRVPTLVVRDHDRLIAWARGKRKLTVFVGYDFSPSSDAALQWVAALKEIGVCRTVIAYVSWPPKETWRFGIGGHSGLTENEPEVRAMLERDLKERCTEVFGLGLPELRIVSSWGPVEEKLVELANAESADLIVLGTNQRHGLSRFWLGSVSRTMLHRTTTNLVCVPAPEEADLSRGQLPSYRRVLVPTDFSKQANRAIAYAYGVVPRGGEICLVHIVPPANVFQSGTPANGGPQEKRKQKLKTQLQALIPKAAEKRGIKTRIEVAEHQHPDLAICQAAERFSANLICLGSRGRSGLKKKLLGSTTEGVMRRSPHPVLIIPN